MVRLTIARKIALAVIAVAIVSIVTMAWVTSANIRRGFLNYLNEMQAQDLEQVSVLIADRYRQEGGWDWLRHKPSAMRSVLDQMKLRVNAEPEGRRPRPDDEAPGQPPAARDDPPPPRAEREAPPPEPDAPPSARPAADDGRPAPPRERPLPPPRGERPAPPELRPPPPAARDPMGFASRLSVVDAGGTVVMGPPDYRDGIARPVLVNGIEVGRLVLRPLRAPAENEQGASGFLREQLRAILWLSVALIAAAVLVALWLARHLLRPVAALRDVTGRIARGELGARAPLLSRDELAELALHVNAMAQSLEAAEQQRRRMIADISHELRTPITVIRGELEALMDGIRNADAGALESLHAEVLRLNKLVEDLHQLTLADSGGLAFEWRRHDLRDLAAPVLERFRARAASAGLALSWHLPEQAVEVRADGDRLTQVLVNLLENSVRYTDRGGRIEVHLGTEGPNAVLTIDDSAPGIPAVDHARIFERLYRVDSARSRDKGGSGLGLAICKALADAHGGSLEAGASPLGGVRMILRLPLATEKET